jgi:hypothetical protein
MKSQDLSKMLETFRASAGTFLHDQARQFRTLSASDQRELLFYLAANMAVSQSAQRVLEAIDPERPSVQ